MKKSKIMSIFLSVAVLFFTGCLTSTTAAGVVGADRNQLMLASAEEMTLSANESYAKIIAEAKNAGKLNRDAATVKRVRDISERLIAQTGNFRADALGWDWQVNVITDETVNAWCMAGGKIVVYTGIIDALKLTDSQLAAVIGHEISHALREHSREQYSRSVMTGIGVTAVSVIAGLSDTGAALLSTAADVALSLPFSRSQETEADNVGTELMARAGYDPREAVVVWEKMSSAEGRGVPEVLSTHPSNESRISNLTSISAKVYPLYLAASKK